MFNNYMARFLELIDTKPKLKQRTLSDIQTDMEYRTLGRTGLKVSVMGLGGGGSSRLGQGTGKSENESIAIVNRALDLGVNFFELAEAYGTEGIVGKALKPIKRDDVVLSTKKGLWQKGIQISGKELIKGVEKSLGNLRTDYVDIYHLHSVKPDEYQYALTELVPTLLKLRDQGKIRFIGITEAFVSDPQHKMLELALQDDCWDVMLVGFNMINQSARERIFAKALEKNIGVVAMFAVRRALSSPENLKQAMLELKEKGLVDPNLFDENAPLDFLIHEDGAVNFPDAAYRYCHYEPGVHSVLSGTGSLEHLEANVSSFLRPPLPRPDWLRLKELFAKVDAFSGN